MIATFTTAAKRAALWLGIILSAAGIINTLGELMFVRGADPDDCKGAAVMCAILIVTALLCRRGLRRMEAQS